MRYRATSNADGTVTVHDIPIFSEAVDARGETAEVYGRARLERWLRTSQQRAREGYFGPTHVGHNRIPEKPARPAGTWAPRRIGDLVLDGAPRATLFVDLTVTAEVAARIQAGELPYVSAELKEDLSEIRSVALLDRTEAPFMKYALLSIDMPGGTVKFADKRVLHFADAAKADDKAEAEKAPKMADADADKKAEDAPKMADAPDASAAVLAILKQIAEKLGIMGGEPAAEEAPAEEATGSPVELMHADKARGARVVSADPVSADPVIAGMRGELAGLRRRLDDGERSTRFSDARGRLVRAGASPDDLKEFDALAKKGASHEPAALAFADSMVRVMPKRAPDAGPWTGELPPRGVVPTDGDAVKKFADRGPLVLDEARRFANAHALLVAKGMTSNTLEDYLSANIDGLQPAGKK